MNARQAARVAIVSICMLGIASAPLLAVQGPAEEEIAPRPSYKDVYCAGFVSSSKIDSPLTIIAGEDAVGRLTYQQDDFVYLSQGSRDGVQVGQEYLVVRRVKDPSRIEAFGRQNGILRRIGTLYADIGRVRVHVVHETTATARIVHVCDAMQNGDQLVPYQERPTADFRENGAFDRFAPFAGGAEGTVVAARDFPALIGRGDAIYVNLGTNQGVKVGDYYRVFRYATGTTYEGAKRMGKVRQSGYSGQGINYHPTSRTDLPREALGEAMVVWVDQDSSTAMITYSVREIHPGDYVEVQPPAPPVASLMAEPKQIVRGQSALLSWTTGNTTAREIGPGVGPVAKKGTTRVSPAQTTTYSLSVSGPGGSTQASATVTVVEPPPPPPPPPTPQPPPPPAPELTPDELFAQNVQDIFFDYNSTNIRPEARAALEHAAQFLIAYPDIRVVIEGHCDERGGIDYNRRLGQHRAEAARDVLVSLGVEAGRISLISYGKERPFCTESSEEPCRQLNRRAHFLRQ